VSFSRPLLIHGFSLILSDMFQYVRRSIVLSPLVPLSNILFVVDNRAALLQRNLDFRYSPKTLPLVPYPICKPTTCFCTVHANIIFTVRPSLSNDYFRFVVISRNPLKATRVSSQFIVVEISPENWSRCYRVYRINYISD
jgi:hypothetical protein